MKKLFGVLLASAVILSACGNDEEVNKEEPKKETKSKAKKNDKEKEEAHKENKKTSTEEPNTLNSESQPNETSIAEQPSNILLTKEEISQRLKNGQNVDGIIDADGDTWYQAPGNGDVIGYTKPDGTVCTVGGCMTPEEQQAAQEQQDANINRTPEEQQAHENWINDQNEWVNASPQEKEEIRKRDAEIYGYEYDPSDYDY